jgi:hypothetical protein
VRKPRISPLSSSLVYWTKVMINTKGRPSVPPPVEACVRREDASAMIAYAHLNFENFINKKEGFKNFKSIISLNR